VKAALTRDPSKNRDLLYPEHSKDLKGKDGHHMRGKNEHCDETLSPSKPKASVRLSELR